MGDAAEPILDEAPEAPVRPSYAQAAARATLEDLQSLHACKILQIRKTWLNSTNFPISDKIGGLVLGCTEADFCK